MTYRGEAGRMTYRDDDRGLPVREILLGMLAIILLAAGALVVGTGGFATAAPAALSCAQDPDIRDVLPCSPFP